MFYESEKLFSELKEGDSRALEKIIEAEKPLLFDFLVRITGHVDRVSEAISSTTTYLVNRTIRWDSLADLRGEMYRQARSLLQDIWFGSNHFDFESELKHLISLEANQNADFNDTKTSVLHAMSSLETHKLEVILLHQRLLFSFEDISLITGREESEVAATFTQALDELERIDITESHISRHLSKFEPIPVADSKHMTDLAEVMNDLDDNRFKLKGGKGFYAFLLLLIIVAGIILLFQVSDSKAILDSMKEMGKGFPAK